MWVGEFPQCRLSAAFTCTSFQRLSDASCLLVFMSFGKAASARFKSCSGPHRCWQPDAEVKCSSFIFFFWGSQPRLPICQLTAFICFVRRSYILASSRSEAENSHSKLEACGVQSESGWQETGNAAAGNAGDWDKPPSS